MVMGIDLAKNVFQLHGVDEDGEVVIRKQLKRAGINGVRLDWYGGFSWIHVPSAPPSIELKTSKSVG